MKGLAIFFVMHCLKKKDFAVGFVCVANMDNFLYIEISANINGSFLEIPTYYQFLLA